MRVIETRKTKLGAARLHTLTGMSDLAFKWKEQNRNAEAVALVRQCGKHRQKAFKADHGDLLTSLAVL